MATRPPGWFPGPSGHQQQRYWDGTTWTANVVPYGPPPAPAITVDRTESVG